MNLDTLAADIMKIGADSYKQGRYDGLSAAIEALKFLADKPEATFQTAIEGLQMVRDNAE